MQSEATLTNITLCYAATVVRVTQRRGGPQTLFYNVADITVDSSYDAFKVVCGWQ